MIPPRPELADNNSRSAAADDGQATPGMETGAGHDGGHVQIGFEAEPGDNGSVRAVPAPASQVSKRSLQLESRDFPDRQQQEPSVGGQAGRQQLTKSPCGCPSPLRPVPGRFRTARAEPRPHRGQSEPECRWNRSRPNVCGRSANAPTSPTSTQQGARPVPACDSTSLATGSGRVRHPRGTENTVIHHAYERMSRLQRQTRRVATADPARQTTRNGPAGRSHRPASRIATTTAAAPLASARTRT